MRSRCRSSRCRSPWRGAASRWSRPRRRTTADAGDQGRRRRTTPQAKFYAVYSGDTARRPRPAHRPRRDRPPAHDGRGPGQLLPAGRAAPRRGGRPDRPDRAALPWRADQPQPAHHARGRCAGDPGALPRGRGRCRDPGRQLPGLPPDGRPGRPPARGKRHRHGGDGLRQGHRRAGRRAAIPVLRLPARQCRRPAERRRVAGPHPRAGAAALEAAPAPRTTVQSPLRWSDDPDWKLDYCNIDRLAPEEIARRRRGVRRGEAAGEGGAKTTLSASGPAMPDRRY